MAGEGTWVKVGWKHGDFSTHDKCSVNRRVYLFLNRKETRIFKVGWGHKRLYFIFLSGPKWPSLAQDCRIPMWETHVNCLFNIFSDIIPKSRKKHQDSWVYCYWCHNIKRNQDRNPAARIWIRRRNHCKLFIEAQMAEEKTVFPEPACQEKHWQDTVALC